MRVDVQVVSRAKGEPVIGLGLDDFEVWLDDRQIINQDLKNNRITIRIEMEPSVPLGIASWKTKAALRDIRLRRL